MFTPKPIVRYCDRARASSPSHWPASTWPYPYARGQVVPGRCWMVIDGAGTDQVTPSTVNVCAPGLVVP